MSRRRSAKAVKERTIEGAMALAASLSIFTVAAIVAILARETWGFFQEVSWREFLFGTKWTPLLEPRSFGVLPLVWGSAMIVVGSAIVALPVGLAGAIYLSEFAGARARRWIKPVLEILAGIPTVVFGYFALSFVTPLLRRLFPATEVFNAASAAIVVGVMILPTVISLCDDALRSVPDALRRGGYAMGATPYEVVRGVVLPGATSGIAAAFTLALSRALGETMAVTLAAGSTPKLAWNPLESVQTMTAYIVQVSLGDVPAGTVIYRTIFAVAALLFLGTLILNLGAQWIRDRYREVGE
jgi:phosphate transport system permease protein